MSIEIGTSEVLGHCDCCGTATRLIRGFVYEDGNAFAVYLTRWTDGHVEDGASMIVGFGDWSEAARPETRRAAVLEWRCQDGVPGCRIVDERDTLWPDTEILGETLPREAAILSGAAATVSRIADAVAALDPRFRSFMEGS